MKPAHVEVAPGLDLLTPGGRTPGRVAVPARGRDRPVAPDRRSDGALAAGGAALAVVVTVLVVLGLLDGLDRAAAVALHGEHRWVDRVGKVTELPGQRAVGYPLAVAVLAVMAHRRRDAGPVLAGLLAMLAVNVVVGGAKLVWARPSPRRGGDGVLTAGLDGTLGGYPSGHAANIAAVAAVLVLVSREPVRRRVRRRVAWPAAAVVLLVCATSWIRSTHWVSDLVAGAGVGLACGAAAVVLLDRRRVAPRPGGRRIARWRARRRSSVTASR